MKFQNSYKLLSVCATLFMVIYGCSDSSTGPDDENNADFNSQANPGASAEVFLQAETFTDLTLEIDYMPGQEPTQRALDSLKTFLQQRLNKTNITFRTPTQIPSGGEQEYSANEIRNLEQQNRDNFTQGDSSTLEAYFIIVDGVYEQQSNVLGIAYYNTSMAFFGSKINEISGGVTQPSKAKIEGTVFRHEFGHNMGLVGNGTPTESPHKTSASAHCTTEGCLMEPEVETSDFFANIFDGNIPELQQFCIQDLQANGGR